MLDGARVKAHGPAPSGRGSVIGRSDTLSGWGSVIGEDGPLDQFDFWFLSIIISPRRWRSSIDTAKRLWPYGTCQPPLILGSLAMNGEAAGGCADLWMSGSLLERLPLHTMTTAARFSSLQSSEHTNRRDR
eukprot:1545341-Pyramimonas_sp.AAC.1